VAAELSAPPTRQREPGVRTDIQALRALAVAMVLAYHLWPRGLSGGFTGVDAFFVISGFLITSHLLARPPSTVTDLLGFWSRRIRRLLPAALLVLAVTLAASRWLAPDTQWENTARQSRAAALYAVNWRLAHDAVDYLASQNAPTPVQHFWSLSVEEQFYLVWPVLILLLALLARRVRGGRGIVIVAGLAVVSALSLWYSVHETAVDPARAYFVTPTRIWELGAGGVLAAAVARRPGDLWRGSPTTRNGLALAGFAAVLLGGVAYGPGTSFPSWHALLPVAGTAGVIAAQAPDTGLTLGRVLAVRPVQWLGDVSYSLYLWHWPLLVLAPDLVHHSLNTVDRLAVLVASLLLAGLTKPLVEDRFRRPSWGRPLIKPYALGAAAMAVVVGITILQVQEVHHRDQQAAQALRHRLAAVAAPLSSASTAATGGATASSSRTTPTAIGSPTLARSCFGAAALTPAFHCTAATRRGQLTPSPLNAAHDRSDAYGSVSGKADCFAYAPGFATITCTRGDVHGTVRVALVGNSHAGQWLPALERAAQGLHWRVTTYLASQCAFARTSQKFPTSADTRGCNDWTARVTADLVRSHYDLVVVTNRISVGAVGLTKAASGPVYQRGYTSVLRTLAAAHLRVVGLRDTPAPGELVPDCLAAHPSNYLACAGQRSAWLPKEPLLSAINSLHDRRMIGVDLTDRICERRLCPAAVGGVPVYVDGSHLTATYAVTLAPYLAPYLVAALHTP
jgi:peptidoglycan/LPS O-acetylase OafA/YrhL